MNSLPLVSIVIPVFNGEKFLQQTLESAISSAHRPLEVIVVDDGSTDSSANVAESILSVSGIFWSIIRQENMGEAAAVNRGLQEVKGEFFMVLSADDLIETELISEALALFEDHPSIGVVYPDQKLIDERGSVTRWEKKAEYSVQKMFGELKSLAGVGTVVRTSVLEEKIGRDSRFSLISDFVFWLQLSKTTNFKRLPGFYGSWRMHPTGTTSTMNWHLWGQQLIAAVREIAADPDLDGPHKLARKRALAKAYLRGGVSQNFPQNVYFVGKALLVDPIVLLRVARGRKVK